MPRSEGGNKFLQAVGGGSIAELRTARGLRPRKSQSDFMEPPHSPHPCRKNKGSRINICYLLVLICSYPRQ